MKTTVLIFGIIFVVMFFAFLAIIRRCTVQTEARYIGVREQSGYRGAKYYSPIYSYIFNGREYQTKSLDTYSKRHIEKRYSMNGGPYPIFVDPDRPERFVISRTPAPLWWLILATGIVFITVSFIV